MNSLPENIFGRVRMGYALIESKRFSRWQQFLVEGLGLHQVHRTANEMAFRMDDHARRLIIRKGGAEDIQSVGWQVDSEEVLEVIRQRLNAHDVQLVPLDRTSAEIRGVAKAWRVHGPKGIAIELFVDAEKSSEPLDMVTSGFNTGDCGMGHIALTSKNPETTIEFWKDIFDARVSDTIEEVISGVTLDITFLRLNPRHHSVAVACTRGIRLDPVRTKIQHMNLEAKTLDDVSNAYRRCRKLGFRIAMSMGQHPNDKEISFYVITPSGFQIELGWNPLHVDEATWQTTSYPQISLWGHSPQDLTLADKAAEFGRGLYSLTRKEPRSF